MPIECGICNRDFCVHFKQKATCFLHLIGNTTNIENALKACIKAILILCAAKLLLRPELQMSNAVG